jgi:parvulin-like peptidyl-prolyl isomerase
MTRALKEPLLHFLLIGGALFLLYDWRGGGGSAPGGPAGAPAARIVVTRDAIDQVSGQYAKTWQRPPTEEEQKGLVEDLVRNEIFYREAVAAGLDRDDEVLKRRLRQKMEFIYEDLASLAEPTDQDLTAFMNGHRERYHADPQLSFRQVYFNPEERGKNTESAARRALAQLAAGGTPDALGDPTMLEPEVPLSPLWEIKRQFGDEFGASLLDLERGTWAGPVRSGFGLHLVFVRERREGRPPQLREIREAVRQDWTAAKQKELKDAAYAKLRERYVVTVEKAKPVAAASGPPSASGAHAR